MKKLIMLFTLFLFTLTSFSQQIDYPIIKLDSLGKVVVIMTLEQAQILDNKAELLDLLELVNSQISDIDFVCIQVINQKDIIIDKQDIQISDLKQLVNNKNEQVDNLQRRISDYILKEELFKSEIINKDKEIKLHLDQISKGNKRLKLAGVIIATLTTILILK